MLWQEVRVLPKSRCFPIGLIIFRGRVHIFASLATFHGASALVTLELRHLTNVFSFFFQRLIGSQTLSFPLPPPEFMSSSSFDQPLMISFFTNFAASLFL